VIGEIGLVWFGHNEAAPSHSRTRAACRMRASSSLSLTHSRFLQNAHPTMGPRLCLTPCLVRRRSRKVPVPVPLGLAPPAA
jgi:hypothetical protein